MTTKIRYVYNSYLDMSRCFNNERNEITGRFVSNYKGVQQ